MYSGKFITFEGIEGCGKSTQAELLKDFFENNNQKVLLTREPGGPKISEEIRDILLDTKNSEMLPETELLLYMASRSQHTGQWIIPKLQQNYYVISDRYYDSSTAYQGAARKLQLNIIDTITQFSTFGLKPSVTFLIDLPAETGLGRIKKDVADRLERESVEFHKRVRNAFLELADKEKERFVILDGKENIETLHEKIVVFIKNKGWLK